MNNDLLRQGDAGVSCASGLQAYASRTLDLLQLIEKTVGRLQADTDLLRVWSDDVRRVIASTAAADHGREIDPDGRTAYLLRKGAAAAKRMHAEQIARRESARADPDLRDDDGVVEAFSAFIDAVAEVHNLLEDLLDTIETLDAERSPVIGGTFGSADDLVADMLRR
jgi:hypothetical protein